MILNSHVYVQPWNNLSFYGISLEFFLNAKCELLFIGTKQQKHPQQSPSQPWNGGTICLASVPSHHSCSPALPGISEPEKLSAFTAAVFTRPEQRWPWGDGRRVPVDSNLWASPPGRRTWHISQLQVGFLGKTFFEDVFWSPERKYKFENHCCNAQHSYLLSF